MNVFLRWARRIAAVFGSLLFCLFGFLRFYAITARITDELRSPAGRFPPLQRIPEGHGSGQCRDPPRSDAHETRADICLSREPSPRFFHQGRRHQWKSNRCFEIRPSLFVFLFSLFSFCFLVWMKAISFQFRVLMICVWMAARRLFRCVLCVAKPASRFSARGGTIANYAGGPSAPNAAPRWEIRHQQRRTENEKRNSLNTTFFFLFPSTDADTFRAVRQRARLHPVQRFIDIGNVALTLLQPPDQTSTFPSVALYQQ